LRNYLKIPIWRSATARTATAASELKKALNAV